MKIGDKVRFLSDIGGGVVAGFQGKLVLVEDEDGFQIPTPMSEIVVVQDADRDKAKLRIDQQQRQIIDGEDSRSIKQRISAANDDDAELSDDWRDIDFQVDPTDDPSEHFEAPAKEREEGDSISVYLAFTPKEIKSLSTSDFKSYLVNDSNYYIHFTYLGLDEENKWKIRFMGELEPNMKLFLEEFSLGDLNDKLKGCIQFHAYKKDKSFLLKPTCDIRISIDAVKFYKENTFRDNLFFTQPALLYTLIENDILPNAPMVEAVVRKEEVLETKKIQKEFLSPSRYEKDELERKTKELAKQFNTERKGTAKQILNSDKIVVDLHANVLLDTTAGMSSADILEYQLDVFRRILEQYKSQTGKKIIFIHGKGEGVLRQALVHELNYKYKRYSYQDASFREYGYGATQVTIK